MNGFPEHIFRSMGEDQVGRDFLFDRFEILLNLAADVWKEAVPEFFDDNLFPAGTGQEMLCAQCRFRGSFAVCGKDNPVNIRVAVFRQQPQYRAAASNLDIIAVGSEAQYFQRSGFVFSQFQV